MTLHIDPVTAPTVTLKFNEEFYDAVPHLYDSATTKGKNFTQAMSEVSIEHCGIGQEDASGHFICKNPDGVRWYFIQSKGGTAHKFDDFKDMLAVQCQQEPILCDQDGYALDGFARWFACIKLGIVPKYQIVNAYLPDDSAKFTWIRSRKLGRHNLSERQRMQIVMTEITAHPERSNSWTAELLGVSRNTVTKYRKQLEWAGKLQNVTKRVDKNGKEEKYHPEKPPTKDEIKKAKEEAANRYKSALMKKAKEVLGENLLQPDNTGTSLSNIQKYLESVDVPEYRLDSLKAVKAALDKKLPPMHEENLGEQYVRTVLNKMEDYLKTAKYLRSYPTELLTVRDLIDKQIAPVELEKHISDSVSITAPAPAIGTAPASSTASATWEVKAHELKKTKKGISIDIEPKQMPDKVDVVEQVKPGPVSFGGKVINFSDHALLLTPHQVQEAILTAEPPKEDDLLATK